MKNFSLFIKATGALLLFISLVPVILAAENPFNDVAEGDSHFVALQFLKEQKLVNGYEDGTFKTDQDINRAEAVKMLLAAIPYQKPPSLTSTTPPPLPDFNFADIKTSDWFYETIKTAYQNKIVEGYPDKLFHPERTLNRAESLKIILLEARTYLPGELTTAPYNDVPVQTWFASFAQVSRERGLFLPSRNNGGELFASETVTRGQFAELIYRLLQSNKGSKFGRATYYADSLAGNGTSNGEDYQPQVFTTAHRTLPFGTKLLVKNLANGKEVEVKVNDRGPYATGMELDLSKSAFSAIASPSTGIITVEYKIIPTLEVL